MSTRESRRERYGEGDQTREGTSWREGRRERYFRRRKTIRFGLSVGGYSRGARLEEGWRINTRRSLISQYRKNTTLHFSPLSRSPAYPLSAVLRSSYSARTPFSTSSHDLVRLRCAILTKSRPPFSALRRIIRAFPSFRHSLPSSIPKLPRSELPTAISLSRVHPRSGPTPRTPSSSRSVHLIHLSSFSLSLPLSNNSKTNDGSLHFLLRPTPSLLFLYPLSNRNLGNLDSLNPNLRYDRSPSYLFSIPYVFPLFPLPSFSF